MRKSKWTFEILLEIAKQYKHINDFKKGSPAAAFAAWARDDYKDLIAHMTPLRKMARPKTKTASYRKSLPLSQVEAVAAACTSKAAFKRDHIREYRRADTIGYGYLTSLTAHMIDGRTK